jgi:hypothetical protein
MVVAAVTAVVSAGAACGDDDDAEPASGDGTELVGVFGITPGECADAGATSGTYFRMVQPGGDPASGPYVLNGDSSCGDKTYTPLAPGRDGGLVTGSFQSQTDPAFDPQGNATSARITKPAKFFAVSFGLATNEKDPQTGGDTEPPTVRLRAGKLEGDLRAFAASWNNQHFNQGAPKPDGSRPGRTTGPTGTYDEESGRYTLEWTSQIVEGPFNNFTGLWHLEGTFEERS